MTPLEQSRYRKKIIKMNPHQLTCCPGTLATGYDTYSPVALRRLFDGTRVSHVLPFAPPAKSEETMAAFIDNRKRLSVSGVQEKLSMVLDGKQLRLTREREQGQYILKPVPRDLKKVDQAPMNEHLTMQLAEQVFGIRTAANTLIFFADGTPAYLTRRFDLAADGRKWGSEDFASLAGKTSENAGPNFKYNFSYEELGLVLRKFLPAWRVEIEKLFQLLVFNYLFSNGDAHLKNFSVLESAQGDYFLSPAYDLLNTRIHVDDTDFALSKGLFSDSYKSTEWQKQGHPAYSDFMHLAERWKMRPKRAAKFLNSFLNKVEEVVVLVEQSYLIDSVKRSYLQYYRTKKNFLKKGSPLE